MSDTTLTLDAHSQLLSQSRLAEDGNETGGILLGCDLGMGSGFIVRHCGAPGPNAVRKPAQFQRDLLHARMFAESMIQLDGSVWIGEWHTHIVELPMPSVEDMTTYRSLLLDREIGFPRLISLIILSGHSGTWSDPRIFAWSISTTSMRPLTITVGDCTCPAGEERT